MRNRHVGGLRMIDARPGLNAARLLRLMDQRIAGCQLDLQGMTVLTEAATGAYCVTPLIAARAGAKKVFAIARDSRFGSAADARAITLQIARSMGADDRIEIVESVSPRVWGEADIVTNSGHLRPITSENVAHMKSTAVIPLMYESWEFRSSDVDVEACRQRGILVAGTNERHGEVGVFDFLGPMAVKLLLDAGIAVLSCRVLLICDNAFGPYIETGLRAAGASVESSPSLPEHLEPADAIVLATTPREESALSAKEAERIAAVSPGAVLLQFFGTLDRAATAAAGIPTWPEKEPEFGHMGILPSAIGPEPIVRLQTGGLKVGEVLFRMRSGAGAAADSFIQPLQ